ncbi:MAG: hypothetical protein ACXVRS_17120, partial [Gaiellaceae bacterium]
MSTSDAATARPPLLRRLVGFNLLSAVVLGAVGYYVGWWLGHQISSPSLDYTADTGQNDIALFFAYILAVAGFLGGLGFFNYPLSRMAGRPSSVHELEAHGSVGPRAAGSWTRYIG